MVHEYDKEVFYFTGIYTIQAWHFSTFLAFLTFAAAVQYFVLTEKRHHAANLQNQLVPHSSALQLPRSQDNQFVH